ncbi:MAG: Rieske 2Fe-2S domain-containing protein [Bacteroidota bacterium]
MEDAAQLRDRCGQTVTAGHTGVCRTRFKGKCHALDNRRPYQGGPLGEGSIENEPMRCPWHGCDFDPCRGKAPGFDDGVETFPVKEEDGAVLVGVKTEPPHVATVADLMVETMVKWGVDKVFGVVGRSNLGGADAMRRPVACFAIAGPGATNVYTGMWDAKVDRAPSLPSPDKSIPKSSESGLSRKWISSGHLSRWPISTTPFTTAASRRS